MIYVTRIDSDRDAWTVGERMSLSSALISFRQCYQYSARTATLSETLLAAERE